MIEFKGDSVNITVDSGELEKAIAYMIDLLEYMQMNPDIKGEEAVWHLDNIRVAIETMKAFWYEHFGEEQDGKNTSVQTEIS